MDELPMPNEVIAQVHRMAIAAEKYNGIVFMDMDGNILSEKFVEGVDNRVTESDNNQLPSEMGAIEEHADQRPQVTEAIEEQTASTIEDESEMNEMD